MHGLNPALPSLALRVDTRDVAAAFIARDDKPVTTNARTESWRCQG